MTGVQEIYALFPERLRKAVAAKQGETFKSLWNQLTPAEKAEVNEGRTPTFTARRLGSSVTGGGGGGMQDSPSSSSRVISIVLGGEESGGVVTGAPNDDTSTGHHIVVLSETQRIEKKLLDLASDYERRRFLRLQEVAALPVEEREASLAAFDKAYSSLVMITRNQLLQAKGKL